MCFFDCIDSCQSGCSDDGWAGITKVLVVILFLIRFLSNINLKRRNLLMFWYIKYVSSLPGYKSRNSLVSLSSVKLQVRTKQTGVFLYWTTNHIFYTINCCCRIHSFLAALRYILSYLATVSQRYTNRQSTFCRLFELEFRHSKEKTTLINRWRATQRHMYSPFLSLCVSCIPHVQPSPWQQTPFLFLIKTFLLSGKRISPMDLNERHCIDNWK